MASLADELQRIAAADPEVEALLRLRFESDARTATVTAPWPDGSGAYRLDPIPVENRPGRLWAGRLPGVGRGAGLEQDLDAVIALGVDRVVCLVPGLDLATLGLSRYPGVARARFGDRFHHVEVADFSVPQLDAAFEPHVDAVVAALAAGESVLVHCYAGCGRTGLFAGCVLVRCGLEPATAIRHFRRHRGCGTESLPQVAYVFRHARRQSGA